MRRLASDIYFSSASSGSHRDLHSFPTRRSSDLETVTDHATGKIIYECHEQLSQHRNRGTAKPPRGKRSEEHTSELQSRRDLVCRLLLEKKKHSTSLHPSLDFTRPLVCRRCSAPR